MTTLGEVRGKRPSGDVRGRRPSGRSGIVPTLGGGTKKETFGTLKSLLESEKLCAWSFTREKVRRCPGWGLDR